jgi:hypothetical protein
VNGLAIEDPSRTFYLEDDIVLTQPWAPIGNITSRFKAKFDGKGHTITINSFDPDSLTGDRDYVGLFGLIDGAEIKDLNIVCNIGTESNPAELEYGGADLFIGVLAGYADSNSLVSDVTVSGDLYILHEPSADAPSLYIGGMTGSLYAGSKIETSSFSGRLGGTCLGLSNDGTVYAGGIAGYMDNSGGIYLCYMSGYVTGESDRTTLAGGIVAQASGSQPIENCYAWANVSAIGDYIADAGGIEGTGDADISKCYTLGTVTAGDAPSGTTAGGITGDVGYSSGSIRYSVALNISVSGGNSEYFHGISGYNLHVTDNVTNNYAASDIDLSSGTPSTTTGDFGDRTYARANFAGQANEDKYTTVTTTDVTDPLDWDFTPETGDWKWLPGYDYPVLQWQTAPPTGGPLPPV